MLRLLFARKRPCGCRRWLGVAGWYESFCPPHLVGARPVRSWPAEPVFPLEEALLVAVEQ